MERFNEELEREVARTRDELLAAQGEERAQDRLKAILRMAASPSPAGFFYGPDMASLSLVLKDVDWCKRYLQQHRYRVTVTGRHYLFVTATTINSRMTASPTAASETIPSAAGARRTGGAISLRAGNTIENNGVFTVQTDDDMSFGQPWPTTIMPPMAIR